MQKAPYFCAVEKRKYVSDKTPLRFPASFLRHKKTGETPRGCLS